MKAALKEAQKAYAIGEIPVGAVIVCDGKIIARGHNLREKQQSVLEHAELVAIKKANKKTIELFEYNRKTVFEQIKGD